MRYKPISTQQKETEDENETLSNDSLGEHAPRDIYPGTDNAYYLGKNDDDSPKAWKGLILKDTSDGKYYRVQCTNGALSVIDLTD